MRKSIRATLALATALLAVMAVNVATATAAPNWGPVPAGEWVTISGTLQFSQTPQWPASQGPPPAGFPAYNPVSCSFSLTMNPPNAASYSQFVPEVQNQANCNGRTFRYMGHYAHLGTNTDGSEYLEIEIPYGWNYAISGPFGNYTPLTSVKLPVGSRGSATTPAKFTLFNAQIGAAPRTAGELEVRSTSGTPIQIVN
jgi:hypothetical protein